MIIKYLVLHLFLIVLSYLVYVKLFVNFHFFQSTESFYSSVWCEGNNHSNRKCRFTNLCFKKDTNDFVFVYDNDNSFVEGEPHDRFIPALSELSAVSNHNKFYFNYVQIPASSLQNLSSQYTIVNIKGKTLIFSRFKPDNLMHLFHDEVLPIYFTLNQIGSNQINNIFLSDDWPKFKDKSLQFSKSIYNQLFSHLNIKSKNEFDKNSIYCFEDAHIGLSKSTIWYQYGFIKPQGPIERSRKELLLIKKSILKIKHQLTNQKSKCRIRNIIFISRKSNRLILNEEELIKFINKKTHLPVIRLRNEEYNDIVEIIEKIRCAKMMVGMHGSALILSMFLEPGSALLELFPFAINPNHYTPYRTLAKIMHIKYANWTNLDVNSTVTHPNYPQELGGIIHLPKEKQNQIIQNNHVPAHLCCSDPFWLFRIYQDTFVDINSFQTMFNHLYDQIDIFDTNQHQSTQFNKLHPSQVLNALCFKNKIDNEKTKFVIKWEKPWNIPFITNDYDLIQYELLVQKLPSKSASSFTTQDNQYVIYDENKSTFNIWIKCKVNQFSGPFISEPIVC